jgi:hypothetical protein
MHTFVPKQVNHLEFSPQLLWVWPTFSPSLRSQLSLYRGCPCCLCLRAMTWGILAGSVSVARPILKVVEPGWMTTMKLLWICCKNKKQVCPMFIQSLFAIIKLWSQFRYPSTDDWIKKMWNRYIMEYYHLQENIWNCRSS